MFFAKLAYMPQPERFVIVNRPDLPRRWNLVAKPVPGTVLPWMAQSIHMYDSIPRSEALLEIQRQTVVFEALGKGIDNPNDIVKYAKQHHDMVVDNPVREVAAASQRYGTETGYQAFSWAIGDKSVATFRRPMTVEPTTDVKNFLTLLATGSTAGRAAQSVYGANPTSKQEISSAASVVCSTFGASNLFVALRMAFEQGIIEKRLPGGDRARDKENQPVIAEKIGYSLKPRRDLRLTPIDLDIGQRLVVATGATSIAQTSPYPLGTVKEHLRSLYKKLHADNAAEAVAKLLVLGHAVEPTLEKSSVESDVTIRELSIITGVAQGLGDAAIGEVMYITPYTVKTHLHRAYDKLNVHAQDRRRPVVRSRVAAVVKMFQLGVFEVQE